MATSGASLTRARFDRFTVDLKSGELRRPDGTCVRIQQKPLQVLRLLLEAEGNIVTRDQLRAALWPDEAFVDFEHGVNTAVKKLRKALEDSVEGPKFVETVPKVGYRFIVRVEWTTDSIGTHDLPALPATPSGGTPATQQMRSQRLFTAKNVAVLGLTMAALTFSVLYYVHRPGSKRPSATVSPAVTSAATDLSSKIPARFAGEP